MKNLQIENSSKDIYDEAFVRLLFNRMSKTYGTANYLSSFGFTERWRKQCVAEIDWKKPNKAGYDLMSGMGESWGLIMKSTKNTAKIIGVDISKEMNRKGQAKLQKYPHWKVEMVEANVLKNQFSEQSADFIISTFGLKTFSENQLETLAQEIFRLLKRGGQFSMVEISVPPNRLLRLFFMFYLKIVIPVIGLVFMGNSMDYKMLGVYCQRFKNCEKFKLKLEKNGLAVVTKSYFFGCATAVVGFKK